MPDDKTAEGMPTASQTTSATDDAMPGADCTCLAYPTPGSPSAFDDWTVDQDPYCPQHGTESGDEAQR